MDEKIKDEANYLEQVAHFTEVSPSQADQLLAAGQGQVVYIGRQNCPYCRKFVAKLSALAQRHDLQVHYVQANHPEYSDDIASFRDKYGIQTVPGLLYSLGNELRVRTDSTMTEAEILAFVDAE